MSSTARTPSEPQANPRGGASSTPDATASRPLDPLDAFAPRHLGPSQAEVAEMLRALGYDSLDALTDAAVPSTIRTSRPFDIGPPRGEHELLAELRTIAGQNEVFRSYLGMGYHGTVTPPVIQRNIFENPGWYTQYTPYQAEISQGRLEALLIFQTMVADLTGLPLAGASLLDEATAAAEAMAMCFAVGRQKKPRFWVASDCHPQTVGVVQTRGRSLGIEVVVGPTDELDLSGEDFCGILLSYPTTDGRVLDHRALIQSAHGHGSLVVMAADLLALAVLVPPGELGADVAVGSTQRFGVPMGFGGPHAAYIATRKEHNRRLPGRIIGVSRDAQGRTAYRMAIQTREQHIRRERATSNICTAQALLAIMAGMYTVYHGPEGIRRIAERVRHATGVLREGLRHMGRRVPEDPFFDTLRVRLGESDARAVLEAARARRINLRDFGDGSLGVSLDETVTRADLGDLLASFALGNRAPEVTELESTVGDLGAGELERTTAYLSHPVFHEHRSETEMLRYLYRLQRRDLSLADSMIPLGSCTMKLNATSEMLPVTWPEIGALHPFAPADQTRGYQTLLTQLAAWLSDLTGFPAFSFMPNAGSQGEYTGLLVIRAYHEGQGEGGRDVCLIPASAHGTNPASAVIAGMRVVPVKCDERGNVDVADLRAKAQKHAAALGALMITYPSTHGVFEESVKEICGVVHEHGGQVYMDGANMNAQVGLCRPAELGADVVHLNLHKTFSIPHGGGGPGMGPIGVGDHLAPFLPTHPVVAPGSATERSIGPVAAATWGSPSILPISWVYIALMGTEGLRRATQVAILNANYMAKRLSEHYGVLYTGPSGLVAHEFILDCRDFDKSAGVKIDDIAKRLADYGFHAPTMSFPVPGTLMIEPTESEPKAELDRLCEALIAIREEIREVEEGTADRDDNVLKGAPHTIEALTADEWTHAYPREKAAYPAPWLREAKFWPPVGRIDNTWGDRHLFCTCPVDGWADDA